MVELGGVVRGTDGTPPRIVACGTYAGFIVDYENQAIAYDSSYHAIPDQPLLVLRLYPSFDHPRVHPCNTQGVITGTVEHNLTIAFFRQPFSWSENFTLDNGTLVKDDTRFGPGESWRVEINETRDDIHYTGYLEVRNLGPWPLSGLDAVASREEFLEKYRDCMGTASVEGC